MSQKVPYILGDLQASSVAEGKMSNLQQYKNVIEVTQEEFDKISESPAAAAACNTSDSGGSNNATANTLDSGIETNSSSKKKRKRDSSSSSSDSDVEPVTVIDCSLPVPLSFARTLTMPLA